MFESDNLTILISLISIVIAISSVFFSIGLQRFELKSIYRSELLNWYKETIEIIFELNYSANQIDNERNISGEIRFKLSISFNLWHIHI